jgi:hypothetical protein
MQLTASLGRESVDRVIGLTHGPNLTAKGNGGTLVLDGLSVGVNVGDGDLDRGVVLGGDQTVGGRALAGDVKVNEDTL